MNDLAAEQHPPESADLRTKLLFWSLAVFLLGYYWLPSTRSLGSTPHDLVFYIGFLPLFLLTRPGAMWVAVRDSRLMAAAMAFVVYLGITALWSQSPTELTGVQVALHTTATAAFLCGTFLLLDDDRWRHLSLVLVSAAITIAGVAIVAYAFGHHYSSGRLHSPIHFEHPNLFAQYLGVALLISLLRILPGRSRSPRRIGYWLGGITILSVTLMLTQSRTTALALAAATTVAFLAARNRRATGIAALLFTAILAAGVFFSPTGPRAFFERGDAGRDEIYTELWQRSEGHRLVGMGLAADDEVEFPVGSSEFPNGFRMPHAHSAFFGTLYWGGIVGLALLLVVIVAAFRRALVVWRNTGDATGLVLLVFGTICLLPDGHRLVSHPHLSSWLLLWLPVARIAASPINAETRSETAPTEAGGPDPVGATISRPVFAMLVVLLCAQRLFHFGVEIDTPHMWRQSDTAHYIQTFAEEGIDLLHPKVCWMGDYEVTILEFPLPEAVAAVGYRVFGPSHRVARAVFFAFFLGSVFFLYRLLDEIFDPGIARMATLIYLAMPLSLFYSRAIHIDFAALFFVHGMAFFFVRGLRRESLTQMWIGSAFAAMAMVIKAPTVVPLTLPLVWIVISERRWRIVARSIPALLAPALLFILWQGHVHRINSSAPDWSFIPSYRKMTASWGWYFGSLAQRLQLGNWLNILERGWFEILGSIGVPAAAVGAVLSRRRDTAFLGFWILGAMAMVLVFFNLFVHHNYYLIPVLAPAAAAVALGLRWIANSVTTRPAIAGVLILLIVAALAVEHAIYAERTYYVVRHGFIDTGRAIERETGPGTLVVVSSGGLDARSPHILYHTGRSGWSVPDWGLSPEVLEGITDLGATTLAIVDPLTSPDGPTQWLGPPRRVVPIPSTGWTVHLFDLGSSPSGPADDDAGP